MHDIEQEIRAWTDAQVDGVDPVTPSEAIARVASGGGHHRRTVLTVAAALLLLALGGWGVASLRGDGAAGGRMLVRTGAPAPGSLTSPAELAARVRSCEARADALTALVTIDCITAEQSRLSPETKAVEARASAAAHNVFFRCLQHLGYSPFDPHPSGSTFLGGGFDFDFPTSDKAKPTFQADTIACGTLQQPASDAVWAEALGAAAPTTTTTTLPGLSPIGHPSDDEAGGPASIDAPDGLDAARQKLLATRNGMVPVGRLLPGPGGRSSAAQIGYVEWKPYNDMDHLAQIHLGGDPASRVIGYWGHNLGWLTIDEIAAPSFDYQTARAARREADAARAGSLTTQPR